MVFQKLVWLTAGQPQEWEWWMSCAGGSVSKCLIPRLWEALPFLKGRIGKLNRQKSFKMLGVCATTGRDYVVGIAGALFVLWSGWEVEGMLCGTCSHLAEACCCSAGLREGQAYWRFPSSFLLVPAEEGCLTAAIWAGCYTHLLCVFKSGAHLGSTSLCDWANLSYYWKLSSGGCKSRSCVWLVVSSLSESPLFYPAYRYLSGGCGWDLAIQMNRCWPLAALLLCYRKHQKQIFVRSRGCGREGVWC